MTLLTGVTAFDQVRVHVAIRFFGKFLMSYLAMLKQFSLFITGQMNWKEVRQCVGSGKIRILTDLALRDLVPHWRCGSGSRRHEMSKKLNLKKRFQYVIEPIKDYVSQILR